jgi:hypothetical protein
MKPKPIFIAALLVLVLAPIARAEGPEQIRTAWNSTRVIGASPETCSFPIQVHSEGLIHDFVYSDGTVKRVLQQHFVTEWTNLENGKVLRSPLAGPGIFYPDGTIVINGNDGRFIAHGEGPVYSDVGRTITTLEGVIFSAGQHSESLFPNVCAALA